MFQKMKSRKGFTLIEMLVVIAIIAVLVAIIVPVVGNSTTKAKAAADAANLRSMAATVAIDLLDNNQLDSALPTTPSKTYGTAPVFYLNAGNINAYYPSETGAATVSGIDQFSASASSGSAPATTSAAGTQITAGYKY